MSRLSRPKWMHLVPAALLALAAAPAGAEIGRTIEQNDTKAQVRQQYRYNIAPCEALKGEERARCKEEAKAARKEEMAKAEAAHREARAEAANAQELGDKELEIQRRLALERCEAMGAGDQAACRAGVRARFGG